MRDLEFWYIYLLFVTKTIKRTAYNIKASLIGADVER